MKKVPAIVIFCLLFLVGCTTGIEKNISEQKNDGVNWSKKRTNLFSSLYYPELSKIEANKLMKEKFDLTMPSFFERSLALTQETLLLETPAQYAIKSEAENLTIRGIVIGKENSDPNYTGLSEAHFQVNQQKQQVYLTKQSIVIQCSASDNKLQGETVGLLLKRLGEAMELPDLDQVMKQAEQKMVQTEDDGSSQMIEIYNDSEAAKKQQSASRILTIFYDETNLVKEIDGFISIE